jgi:hypothetical protein
MENSKKLASIFEARKGREQKKIEKDSPKPQNSYPVFVERFGEEQLKNWKQQFDNRELIFLKVEDSLAVLRPPTVDDLGDYMTAIGTNGMGKAVALIVEQLWLDGDYKLIEDEDSFIAVFLQVNNILEGKKAEFFRR